MTQTTATTATSNGKPTTRKKGGSRAKQRRLITAEDMKCFVLVSDVQVCPCGDRLLFTRQHLGEKNKKVNNLWLVDAEGVAPRQFTSGGADGHGRWSPDCKRIAFVSGREKPIQQIFLMEAEGGEAKALTKFPPGSIGGFKWAPDGQSLAVTFREAEPDFTQAAAKKRKEEGLSDPPRVLDDLTYRLDGDGYFGGQRFALYIVDIATGAHRKVYDKDALGWFSFDWSPSSKQIAITTNRDKRAIINIWNYKLTILDVKTKKTKDLANVPVGIKESVTWSPDGKWLAYSGQDSKKTIWGCHNMHLFVVNAMTGATKKISADSDYCLQVATLGDTAEAAFEATVRWSADSKSLLCRVGWNGNGHIASIPAKGGPFTFLTDGGANWDFGYLSADGKRIGAVMQSHTKLVEVQLVELEGARAKSKSLTDFNGAFLKEVKVAKPVEKWLTTPDGTKVHCWVMKPPNFKAGKKYPAVLEVHGGPHTQYGSAFFHEFQVLAAAGYVVFFSNPRGSKGYGEDHCAAIRGDWGNKDWIDVVTVKDYMKKQSYVDPKRLGIMGGSYGGYITNWAIGHTHDFAGAITDRCVSNMISMSGSSDFPLTPDEYWEGAPWDRPEKLWQQSPIAHFKKAKTPTLIIHSEGDLRCNVEQGEQVFSALKVLKVPTRFVRYPRSTFHGMSRGGPVDLRIHRLHQILEWWKKYLK
ncbi:MAG: S9 family peptidase [Phycisphaerales bacterium JB038]